MNKPFAVLAGLVVILAATSAGYRIGTGNWPSLKTSLTVADGRASGPPASSAVNVSRRVLYLQDPDGKPAYSAIPAKTADGRAFVPVYEDQVPDTINPPREMADAKAPAGDGARKIKYYRNPMGLPDTSRTPKKDWMGMEYLPVYEGEEEDGSSVRLSAGKVQRTGVRSEPAQMRLLSRPVRAPGIAKIDERTMRDVTMRADAFIEKLYIAETGKHIRAGEPLFRIYSPDIVRAEVDYSVATSGSGRTPAQTGLDIAGATQRLQNFDVPESIIGQLKSNKGAIQTQIDWPSPVSGVIIEKNVIEGQKVNAGRMLYRIADLSRMWVIADVAEQDIGFIKIGAPATIVFRAYPDESFQGRVTFILHELAMTTRTAKVRIEIDNPEHRILHDMFADVSINAGDGDVPRLSVPVAAVLDTGERQVVLVDKGDGRFEPTPVKLGMRGDGYVEVKDGIVQGDNVVTTANFLIDAESNLKAALKNFTPDTPAPRNAAEVKP
jgi:Cu(I)/Ag(I) efflux system membrane fusion protein